MPNFDDILSGLDKYQLAANFAELVEEEYEPQALSDDEFLGKESELPPVHVTYSVKKRKWKLLKAYKHNFGDYRLKVPKGFEFDLSSVPRMFWWAVAPNELSIVAPLFHDMLYDFEGKLPDEGYVKPYRTFTRKDADLIFLYLMEKEGVPDWRRMVGYNAVRAFGGLIWVT